MRVKPAVHSRKRKKSLFKAAKGYRGGRSRLLRTVKDAVDRAREYSYRDRKVENEIFGVYGLYALMPLSVSMA